MEKMENLPVRRQIDRAGFFHGCADVFARDLPRPGAQRDSSPAGDALDMRAANGDDCVAYRTLGHFFGSFNSPLNALYSFIQFNQHALARSPRFGGGMAAIAQASVAHIANERHRLGAPYIQDSNCIFLVFSHGPLTFVCAWQPALFLALRLVAGCDWNQDLR